MRVHGVENLRNTDAGVKPFIPNVNTHCTTCGVALRGVDVIFGELSSFIKISNLYASIYIGKTFVVSDAFHIIVVRAHGSENTTCIYI